MLDFSGMGLIANLIGLIVFILAAFGIARVRAPNVLMFWFGVAFFSFAVVICGTSVVIACE